MACLRYDLAHRVMLSLHLVVERRATLHARQRALDVLDELEQDGDRIGSLGERALLVFGELEPSLECRLVADDAVDLQHEQVVQHLLKSVVCVAGLQLLDDLANLGLVDVLRGSSAATPWPPRLHIRIRRAATICGAIGVLRCVSLRSVAAKHRCLLGAG